jgi:hypothetical protein
MDSFDHQPPGLLDRVRRHPRHFSMTSDICKSTHRDGPFSWNLLTQLQVESVCPLFSTPPPATAGWTGMTIPIVRPPQGHCAAFVRHVRPTRSEFGATRCPENRFIDKSAPAKGPVARADGLGAPGPPDHRVQRGRKSHTRSGLRSQGEDHRAGSRRRLVAIGRLSPGDHRLRYGNDGLPVCISGSHDRLILADFGQPRLNW